MSPALRGSQIGRSTGRRRINLRVLAALGTADPEQLADATLNALTPGSSREATRPT